MSDTLDPDDFEALEELWNLPSPGDAPHEHKSEKARRNAMYEYCYAKRDHLEHHIGEGKRMLKTVLADIERLHDEEREELATANKSPMRRITDRRKR